MITADVGPRICCCWGSSRVKQYFREYRALRPKTVISYTRVGIGIGRSSTPRTDRHCLPLAKQPTVAYTTAKHPTRLQRPMDHLPGSTVTTPSELISVPTAPPAT